MTGLLIAITFFIRAKFLPITPKAKDMISPGIAFFSFDAGVQEHTTILYITIFIYELLEEQSNKDFCTGNCPN